MIARKRLTIGVELAAKPELLLFLDEVRCLFPCRMFRLLKELCFGHIAYVGSGWSKRMEFGPFLEKTRGCRSRFVRASLM